MPKTENEIIEKIKKLLCFKNGGTPSEIQNALFLAKQLADKHKIDLNTINPNEEREPITHASACEGKSRLQYEVKYSALIVSSFFNVESFARGYYKKEIIFVGTESDIEIATYVFNFLVSRVRYEWNNNRGRIRNRQSFMWGLYTGICYKLSQARQQLTQQEGIILSDRKQERRDYLQKFGELETKNVKPDKEAKAAQQRGFIAGLNTNINKGISTTQKSKMLN